MKKKIFLSIIALLVFNALIIACGSMRGEPELEQISVRLKWLHQAQFAGIYIADQEGYYAEEGLQVKIEPIDLERQITYDYVLAGEQEFAIGAAEEMIIARSQGLPVRAVAVIFRITPLVYFPSDTSGITSPADFPGKTLALSPGQGTFLYEAMMGQLDIDRSQIHEIDMTVWGLDCWETADVCSHYATNEVVRAQLNGVNTAPIWPHEYGVPFYGDVIFTSDTLIEENPDLVERFVRATLKGWQRAIENPELAAQATLTVAPEQDYDFQLASMIASIPLIDTGEGSIGWMDPNAWEHMYEILLAQNIIPGSVNLDTVYTNEFIEKADD